MSRSEKHAQSRKESWIIAIVIVLISIGAFIFVPALSAFWAENKLLVTGIILFMFLGSLWQYSKPYWRLRDKIVDTVTDGTYGTKRSSLRAIGLGIIVVFAALVLITLYAQKTT